MSATLEPQVCYPLEVQGMRGLEGLRTAQSPTYGQPHRYAWGHLAELLLAVGSSNGFPGEDFGGDDLHLPPFHPPALGDDDGGRPGSHRCRSPEYLQSQKPPAQASENCNKTACLCTHVLH